jgi:hypothetical protein
MGNVVGDAFVTYDELQGPDLDAARWSTARLPLPTGDEHTPVDPGAEVAVVNRRAGIAHRLPEPDSCRRSSRAILGP